MWFNSIYDLMWFLSSLIHLYSPFFVCLIIAGILISISRNSWFIVWIGLEINIYSFIPLLLYCDIYKRKEAAAKYFLVQALGSAMILTATLSISTHPVLSSTIFISRLLLKAGLAPIHFWYPRIIAILPWFSCALLSTIQKLAPILLLICIFPINSQTIINLGAIIVLIGGFGGINQTQLRTIIAYSSIRQRGWIITASQISIKLRSIILINYILSVSTIILIFAYIQWWSGNERNYLYKQLNIILLFLIITLINLAGVPPFPGFMLKAITIYKLTLIRAIKTSIIIILGSIISLYFYLKIIFNTLFSKSNITSFKELNLSILQSRAIIFFSLTTTIIFIFMCPWLI